MENNDNTAYIVAEVHSFDTALDYTVYDTVFDTREEAREYLDVLMEDICAFIKDAYSDKYTVSEDGTSVSTPDGDTWRYLIKKLNFSESD